MVTLRLRQVTAVLEDPLWQRLINSAIPARLAYVGSDGYPRVVPIGFVHDGERFVAFTAPNSAKVAQVAANPKVALTIDTESQPPDVLLARGIAQLSTVTGIPDQFIEAARKLDRTRLDLGGQSRSGAIGLGGHRTCAVGLRV